MALDVAGHDPYVDHLDTTVIDAAPTRAVVEQPASACLGNHVGVRHASALYTAGHAAARALVLAALGDRAGSAGLHLVESEIAYVHVGFGLITTTAEPAGGGWDSLDSDGPVDLDVSATGTDENGKTVVTLATRWRVEPAVAA